MNFYPLGAKACLKPKFRGFRVKIALVPALVLGIAKFYLAGNGKRTGEDARPTMRPLLV